MNIPEQIKDAREAAGLSKAEAARRAEVDWSTWSRWEAGISEPSFEQLGKIATLLGVTLEVKP